MYFGKVGWMVLCTLVKVYLHCCHTVALVPPIEKDGLAYHSSCSITPKGTNECRSTTQKVRLSLFVLSTEMQSFVTTALIVLAAVFCNSHVDGSRASEVNSVQKRQVPLPPAVATNNCISVVLVHPPLLLFLH